MAVKKTDPGKAPSTLLERWFVCVAHSLADRGDAY
jgi:hypothetical protein